MSNEQKQPKLTAAQRLENVEQALMSLYQTCNNMAQDLQLSKEAIRLLGSKLDAVQKVAGVTDEQVSEIMVQANVAELKQKADNLLAQGLVSPAEEITDNSFVVATEQDDTGKTVNPRLQFMVGALTPELKAKIVGSKAGDVLTLQEGKLKLAISEVYSIVQQTAPEATDVAAADQTAAQ